MEHILLPILECLGLILLVAVATGITGIVMLLVSLLSFVKSLIMTRWLGWRIHRIDEIGYQARREIDKLSDDYLRRMINSNRR